jgi:hypothetical protein
MLSPGCHDYLAVFLCRFISLWEKVANWHFQRLCKKVSVLVRGYILLQLDIAEHIAGDAEVVQDLHLRNQRFLGQPLLITKPGNIAANEIRVASHNVFVSFIGLAVLRQACQAHKIKCGAGESKKWGDGETCAAATVRMPMQNKRQAARRSSDWWS